jgi:hypothetical protein
MLKQENDQALVNNSSSTQEEKKYVVLMETSGEECESWYYSILYNGNEKNLQHLQQQLESVNWYILEDLSTFDLDMEHFISEKTAKELTKLELNHYSFHRKFDGILSKIDLNLKTKDKNEKKMGKVFDKLGYGQIEDYIGLEDIDEEDLTENHSSDDSNKSYNDDEQSQRSDKSQKSDVSDTLGESVHTRKQDNETNKQETGTGKSKQDRGKAKKTPKLNENNMPSMLMSKNLSKFSKK